ncbi:MAG TPA: GGDEF domain-containing protein [Gaiellales bacterium]|nr:GGDEF domain-containing protein [Gaiellales bacterium]
MVYALLAFLAGALASTLVLAVRERRRAAAMEEELERLRGEAAMLERRDADTGLWNSRHFVEALTREIERSRTYGRPVALALASVDGLDEDSDDTQEALRLLGTSIGGSVRALDVACRVGTTEFGVIMAETDSRSASVAAERVLRAMARIRSPNGLQPQAAVGIAACPAHAEGFDELVERAGSALRSARRAVRREEPKAGTVTVSMAVWDDDAFGE